MEKDGTSLHSVGDTSRTGYLKFCCRDTVDDFYAEMAIPEPEAIQAAIEFFETGGKPQRLIWEADW